MNKEDIKRLTIEHGELWRYHHVQRVLKLIEIIGEDLDYDKDVVWYAAFLHDWGAIPEFQQKGVDHAIRSKDLAADLLQSSDLSAEKIERVLYAIENHDYRNENPVNTTEAVLLREADYLDFLGAIGIARRFAQGTDDMQKCLEGVFDRRDKIQGRFTIPKAMKIAENRIREMNQFIESLEQESLGFL